MATAQKTVTTRVSEELHTAALRLAHQRGESLNALIEKALARELREQEDREFYDSFTLIAQDKEASGVEFAAAAQFEVVKGA